ncbi:MAG: divergent PAP2 family protein [Clostridia bacterium]|nr:divergent PAP2 family protein [Clostridia bacterium]
MKTLMALLHNYVLVCTLSSWATAQVLKLIINYVIHREVQLERLSGAGGMPSAHSATVTALVISCARYEGIGSTFFAIAVALAAVVIYDAMGVRHEAGEHAKIINQMLKESKSGAEDNEDPDFKELKEMLGHTPIEVVGGVMTGILVPLIIPIL